MSSLERIFPGNSELAGRMRALDWSTTELGPPDAWPERLRSAVSICLLSRFPIVMWWGPKMSMLYNDAYISVLGRGKHPASLARSFKEAWAEIWPTIGPMLEGVRKSGEASWSEDTLLIFDRDLPKEEVYATFSFSPLIGNGNEVDGIFCACTETTDKLVGSRRIDSLRRLGLRALEAPTVDEACQASAEALAENPHDVPFAAVYVIKDGDNRLTLRASAGLQDSHALPHAVSLASVERSAWPLAAALRSHRATDVELAGLGPALPGGPWPEPAEKAVVLPIPGSAPNSVIGVLIAGVSPRRVLNAQYRTFFDLVAGHVSKAITKAQAFEAERQRAEALAEIDRAKTAFFSNVSHEFRTPLTLMLASIEDTLAHLSSWPQEAVRGQLGTAHRNALRLLKLVNALLDFPRIQAGRVQASFEPVDLAAVTTALASAFRAAIERAGLTFAVRCEPLPEPVYVDREMWEKIVLNLLSNAFKFTFEGEIELVQRVIDDRVELTVRDTGIGVAPEEVPRLFERFHRVEGAKARTHEGSGIGLSLVRELLHMNGGEIRADSELGRGTQFTISLHLGVAHLPSERIGGQGSLTSTATGPSAFVAEALRWLPGAADGPPNPPPSSTAVPTARILVVDDNADMREYLTRLLAERWVVEPVADGEAALAAVRGARFDLILTDVMMPRLDGLGLLKALRADPTHNNIPVIMLSARAGEESKIEGLESGADDYLIKPFSAREVVTRIEAHLKLSQRAVQQAAIAALGQTALGGTSIDDLMDEAVLRVSQTLRTELAKVLELTPGGGELLLCAGVGWKPELVGRVTVSAGRESQAGFTLLADGPVVVTDLRTETRFTGPPLLFDHDVVSGVSCVIRGPDGRPYGVLGTHTRYRRDFSETEVDFLRSAANVLAAAIARRQAEVSLRESEERFRSVSESGVVALAFFNVVGAIVDANDAFLDLVGYTRAELAAGEVRWDRMTPPEWMPRTMEAVTGYRSSGRIEPYEKEYFRKGGERFWGLFGGRRTQDTGEGIAFVLDITERKRAETALHESQERMKLAVRATRMVTWEWLPLKDRITTSDNFAALYGLPALAGAEGGFALVLPEDREAHVAKVQRVAAEGGSYISEFRIRRPDDGRIVWLEERADAQLDAGGHVRRLVGVTLDITERKLAEEARAAEAASAEREIRGYQERIQQMAFDAVVTEERERRRIAADLHDGVGQSLALSQITLTAARQEIVGSPRQAIDRAIALIGESIASTRTLTFELSPPILYDLGLKEALCWLAEKLEETHETRIEIADDETHKPLDNVTAGLVFRATRELLMNVIKHSRAPTAKVSLRRVGDRLAVTVEDTGVGFDPANPTGRSGGFGLLGVREQIRRLRGSTEVISAPGRGARVAIYVPIPARDQGESG